MKKIISFILVGAFATIRAASAQQDVNFISVGVESGAYTGDINKTEPCIVIHTKFDINNKKGVRCKVVAYFYLNNGEKLMDYNKSYNTTDGQVAVSREITPSYDNSTFHDLHLKIPVSELHLSKNVTYKLKFYVKIYELKNEEFIGTSDYVSFTIRTYGDSKIYGQIEDCSSFAFGKRMGNCYFENNHGAYGYESFYFSEEDGQYYVYTPTSSEISVKYLFTDENENYYVFQMGERKVTVNTSPKYVTYYDPYFGVNRSIRAGYNSETKVTFNILPNAPKMYVAKNGKKIVIERALPNGGNAEMTKEITHNEVLAINKQRGSASSTYTAPVTSGNSNISTGYSSSYSSSSNSSSKTRRTCPCCNGSGKLADQVTYGPCYTGNCDEYCSICGRTTSRHSHHRPLCRLCYGKGYVE